jgi:membrane protein implicated in regulation of membrane protease activity
LDFFFVILAFGAFVIVAGLLAYFSYQQQQRRLAELHALAVRLDWRFTSEEDSSYDNRYSQFAVFCQGSARYAYNTLNGNIRFGDESWPARLGDYHYQTTSTNGKRTQTHHHYFSYLLIDLPYPSAPDLRIRREGIFDALAGAFGFDDTDFESAEFSKRFHVKSSNKKFAYNVIDARMMEFLLAEDSPAVEIDGGCCCMTDGSTWSAVEFNQRLHWVVKFFDLWPRHVVADLRTR